MNTINLDPVELGKKLKLARQTKGLSQEKLAELAQTSCQNISKFENKGLSDINWIKTFSQILDVNLIGEMGNRQTELTPIGKEVMSILIRENGYCDYRYMIEEIKIDEITVKNEVESLCFNNWIKRKIYDGWYGYKEDKLFVTKLGIVIYSNSNINSIKAEELSEKEDDISTYENVKWRFNEGGIWNYDDIQSYIKNAKDEYLIHNIYNMSNNNTSRKYVRDESCLYLINFIYNLKECAGGIYDYGLGYDYEIIAIRDYYNKYYESFNDFEELIDGEKPVFWGLDFDFVPHKDCQSDIEYRMRHGITNDILLIEDEEVEEDDEKCYFVWKSINESKEEKTFSIDEYKDYINKYYRMPETDYERMIYDKIIEIISFNNYDNSALTYFSFSKEWVENGLASLVLDNLGLKEHYINCLKLSSPDQFTYNLMRSGHGIVLDEEIKKALPEHIDKLNDYVALDKDYYEFPFV